MALEDTKTIEQWVLNQSTVETTTVTIKSGVNVPKFAPLMMEVATGKVIAYDKALVGTNVTAFISAYAIDASGGDMSASVYKAGEFNKELVVWTTSPSQAQIDSAFAGTPISLGLLHKG